MANFILSGNVTLDNAALHCAQVMESAGYTFPTHKIRLRLQPPSKILGRCHFKEGVADMISISQGILNNKMYLERTLYHEMAHAILPWAVHHGKQWQKVVAHISKITGYNITRTSSTASLGENYVMSFKHVYRCKECGKTFGRGRLPRWDRYIGQKDSTGKPYITHSGCGGELEKIK